MALSRQLFWVAVVLSLNCRCSTTFHSLAAAPDNKKVLSKTEQDRTLKFEARFRQRQTDIKESSPGADYKSRGTRGSHLHTLPHAIMRESRSDTFGLANFNTKNKIFSTDTKVHSRGLDLQDSPPMQFTPGDKPAPFQLPTLRGELKYPGQVINSTTPVLFHAFSWESGFVGCLWNCSGSVEDLVMNSPMNTHYVFMSRSEDAYDDSLWMRGIFLNLVTLLIHQNRLEHAQGKQFLERVHFVTVPVHKLGNWIPGLLQLWVCQDHNCGLDQVVFESPKIKSLHHPLTLKRLDARYDWLPSPATTLPTNATNVVYVNDGCEETPGVKGRIAMVTDKKCSYFQKVSKMQDSGAVGVLVLTGSTQCLQDMNCNGSQCSTALNIPASMIPFNSLLTSSSNLTARFQNTPTSNFFFGIDGEGKLAEVGWLLYPTFHFLAWQAQWFNYKTALLKNLSEPAMVISVFNDSILQGKDGAVHNVTLPPIEELSKYSKFELDLALSCPGTRDTDCAHWDHTLQLYTCCNHSNGVANQLCGMELGRWITPFRRRIGRWLTDVTVLLPLLEGQSCTFTLKTAPWAMEWVVSLNLRFSKPRTVSDDGTADWYPYKLQPLYQPSFTFDRNYNSHFVPVQFETPPENTTVGLASVITGHGSDENGCGEFCVTSHHFSINGFVYTKTFSDAGSPLGCAKHVPDGVEPNEHGTWLYGRGGWCDGQEVQPWVVNITGQLNPSGLNNVGYYGYFNGTDPNPKQNPGVMIFFSYLVYFKRY